jgi:hypothetical protein
MGTVKNRSKKKVSATLPASSQNDVQAAATAVPRVRAADSGN